MQPHELLQRGYEVVRQMSRRVVKGEDPHFFDITPQLVNGLSSAPQEKQTAWGQEAVRLAV